VDQPIEGKVRVASARFGNYEADFEAGELRKHGLRIKIQDKPLRLLQALVERPGQLVTREELRARVWSSDVYVDFDSNLKIALNKLRTALCDSAESPRYIETLPRRGYRFIALVEHVKGNGPAPGEITAAGSPANGAGTNGNGAAPALLDSFSASPSPSQPAARFFLLRRWSRASWAAAGIVLAAVGGMLFVRATHHLAVAPLKFHQRDWVLVSRFENRSGEPVLDGTVDFAVGQELSNSQFVGIVPPERIGDDLRLMKKPAGTPLGPALAREICLRDGDIRALITGRVEKIGTTYLLSAGIADPATGAQVAGMDAEAKDLNGVLPAIRQLSNQLRESLGETLPSIRESNSKLEKVTTPSLRALQLYSQAITLSYEDPTDKPIPLLEQALAEDPNFASAHILLAHCYSNLGKDSQAAPHYEKAFQLAGSASERERLFILGSYYERFKRNPDEAIQAYEALARLYPDDYWGTNNLAFMLLDRGRADEAVDLMRHLADLRPADLTSNFSAWVQLRSIGREAEASRYLARATSLITPESEKEFPYETIELEAHNAQSDMHRWNVRGALEETRKLAQTYTARTGRGREQLVVVVGVLYLHLGKLRLADEWFQKLPPGSTPRKFTSILLGEARGGTAGLRRAVEKQLPIKGQELAPDAAVWFARCGMLRESQQMISRLERMGAPTSWLKYTRGALTLAEGHRVQAIGLLKEDPKDLLQLGAQRFAVDAADLLATAYEQQGQIPEAINTLQRFEDQHLLSVDKSFHLCRLYTKAGDTQDAQKIEQNLLRRLAYADPDYPILVQLHRQMDLHAALHF
jgi:DNA-binding winged helix-turn-helix (wHTH) protein/tetratricopeptide (TPR) repeat protein